jgi:hypothetical protein
MFHVPLGTGSSPPSEILKIGRAMQFPTLLGANYGSRQSRYSGNQIGPQVPCKEFDDTRSPMKHKSRLLLLCLPSKTLWTPPHHQHSTWYLVSMLPCKTVPGPAPQQIYSISDSIISRSYLKPREYVVVDLGPFQFPSERKTWVKTDTPCHCLIWVLVPVST